MDIEEFGPDDGHAVAAYADLATRVGAVDAPWLPPVSAYRTEMDMRHGWDGEVGRFFLARVDAEVVGCFRVDTSEWDNLEMAWVELAVAPERRRQGYGSRLLELAVAEARGMGRPLVGVNGWDSPGVRAFAAHHGFPLGSQEIARRMRLAEADFEQVRALRDEAAAAASAYELVRIVDRTPDDLIDAVAELTDVINDAPMDDLEHEDEIHTPQRVRDYEEHSTAAGWRLYRLAARHRTSGALAGHTVVLVDRSGEEPARQHDTSVARAHRGHRLGLLLKAEMVLWLADAEPDVDAVDTWNAESNDHMIAVNERLGYTWMGRMLDFQKRLPG